MEGFKTQGMKEPRTTTNNQSLHFDSTSILNKSVKSTLSMVTAVHISPRFAFPIPEYAQILPVNASSCLANVMKNITFLHLCSWSAPAWYAT